MIGRASPLPRVLAAALLLLAGAASPAFAAESVLVVGAPREGPAAALVEALRAGGRPVTEMDGLSPAPPPAAGLLVLARAPRTPDEAGEWEAVVGRFLAAGGRVAAVPAAAPTLRRLVPAPGSLGAVVALESARDVAPATDLLSPRRASLVHPAALPEAGVAPALLALPLPRRPAPLPPRTLLFLLVAAGAAAAAALLGAPRRRGGRVAAVGLLAAALAFLPGMGPPPTRETRLRVVERGAPGAAAGRILDVVEVEALRRWDRATEVVLDPRLAWAEVRPTAGSGGSLRFHGGGASAALPGAGALVVAVGVGGGSLPPSPEVFRWSVLVEGGRAWREEPGRAPAAPAESVDPGRALADVLADLRRSTDAGEAAAGALLEGLLRPVPGARLRVAGPGGGGATAEVIRLP